MIAIKNRFFLVGAPRSGTTLLQSFLAAHSQINSFPETHFFSRIANKQGKLRYKLPFARNYRYCKLKNKIALGACTWKCITLGCVVRLFIRDLDGLALTNFRTNWLEKTPEHLHHVNAIQNCVDNVRFIHMVRNAKDVVASFFKVTKQYPLEWGGRPRSVKECVTVWNNDLALTEKYSTNTRLHYVLRYEDLTKNTELELRKLCEWMGIRFETNIVADFHKAAPTLILAEEKWKDKNLTNKIQNSSSGFENIFTIAQQEYIHNNIIKNKYYPN